ncbi:hypothetical protein B9Y60_12245 [Stenotrophomonas maltophilia]|nr:hypothetical protein [Stenotrophomonas maltophilia]PJL50572.1 hypothetical protein B9Y73_12250 [Stenotrophomonas maltophilia]PJL54147.1 hypothetical protein B9Y60_12245 [Stenotrophomonas maltophilia]
MFEERLEQVQMYREGVRRELYESLSDSEFSWKSALWNDDCHVEEFDAKEGGACAAALTMAAEFWGEHT